MANLSNINNRFLVTTGGNVLIGQTSAIGSSIFQVTGASTFTGNILMGNTVPNPASGFANQTGIGLKYSTTVPTIEVSSDAAAMQLGRSSTGGEGQILGLRKAGTIIHNFDTNNVSIGTNATFAGNVGIVLTNTNSVKLGITGNSGLPATSGTTQTGLLRLKASNNATLDMGCDHTTANGWLQVTDVANLSLEYNLLLQPNGGNVGIGTNDPQNPLHIKKEGYQLKLEDGNTTNTCEILASNNTMGFFSDRANAVASSDMIFSIDNDTKMVIDTNGNVGIGTDSPSALLEIQTAGTSGSQDMQIFSRGVSPNYEVLKISRSAGSTEFLANQNLTLSADYDANHTSVDSNIIFKTDNVERMRVTSNGIVEIGAIPSVAPAILSVRKNGTCIEYGHGNNNGRYEGTLGAFGSSGFPYIGFSTSCDNSVNNFTTRGWKGNVINSNDYGDLIFAQATNANASGQSLTERMRIKNDGNVGIGTTSPNAQLEISNPNTTTGAGGATLRLTRADSTSVAGDPVGTIEFYSTDADGPKTTAYIKSMSEELYGREGSLAFGVSQSNNANATEAMRIDSNGRVGIGTTLPSQQLELGGIASPALKLTSTSTNGGVIIFNVAGADKGFFGSGYHLGTGSSNDTAMRGESDLVFLSGGNNQRMRITSGGVVEITNGIKLGGTAAANLLDDYEEGTFTPVLTRSSGGAISATYTTQEGNYIKIGNLVYIQILVNISAIASQGSGYVILTGLPFSSLQFAYTQISNVSSNIFGSTNIQKSFTSSQSMYFGEASITNFPPIQTAYSVGILRVCGTYRV